jgi:dTDP-4-dehydrorhamnose 3,5-epimerase
VELVSVPMVGAFVVEVQRTADDRGSFARTFDADRFEAEGLDPRVAQTNLSHNPRAGTLRGLHFQAAPHGEAKLVRVVRGASFHVLVDLRPTSDTYGTWFGIELSAAGDRALYAPAGCAHGFQTLLDDTEVLYQMSTPHVPAAAAGVRWDDPAFGVAWPDPPPHGRVISQRDATYPDFRSCPAYS